MSSNYQRISRKYPTSAFRLRNNRMGICRFDAELGIHKPVRYLDFTTVRRLNKKDSLSLLHYHTDDI